MNRAIIDRTLALLTSKIPFKKWHYTYQGSHITYYPTSDSLLISIFRTNQKYVLVVENPKIGFVLQAVNTTLVDCIEDINYAHNRGK